MANNRVRLTQDELIRIEAALDCMSYDSGLYRLLKRKLSARGNWRDKARGKPGLRNLTPNQWDTDSELSA